MTNYKKINSLCENLQLEKGFNLNLSCLREWKPLLQLLEEINNCEQSYEIIEECIIVSYKFKINLLNFKKIFPLKLKVEIIGLPISISHQGYFGDVVQVKSIIEKRKGFKIILNSDQIIENGGNTLSSFIFYNRFKNLEDYINSLRSAYRRRINQALANRKYIIIKKINNKHFTEAHYELYLSIIKRSKYPLEILPIDFFCKYQAEIYEFRSRRTDKLLGFIQVKQIDKKLLFLFGGFNKVENKEFDLYYNMLLKIIELGIERNIDLIEFGQTAEESKLKIGCVEVKKYLYIHHHNLIINKIMKILVPFFSYKPYNIKHNVFKEDANLKVE